jgi:hypothetical protein
MQQIALFICVMARSCPPERSGGQCISDKAVAISPMYEHLIVRAQHP